MPPADFDSFVQKQQDKKTELNEFWGRERDQYIGYVNKAYENIEEFLSAWTSNGSVTIEYHDIEIHEENTGIYYTRKCIIAIGNKFVALTPVGTQLIGTKGRIDVSGAFGQTRLILADKDAKSFGLRFKVTHMHADDVNEDKEDKSSEKEIEWTWKIVSNPPSIKFEDFNRENFLSKIMEISNG